MKPLIHFLQQHLPSTTGFTGRLRIKPLKGDGRIAGSIACLPETGPLFAFLESRRGDSF